MNWKLVLLTSTAVVSVSLFATGAQAEGPPSNYEPPPEVEFRPPPPPPPVLRPSQAKPCCEPSGWYVSVLGGGNWTDDQLAYHFAANPSGGGSAPDAFYAYQEYKAETGFVVGAAVGKDLCCWLPGLRGEVELTYRRNEVNGYHEDGTDTLASSNQQPDVTGPIEGTISSWALMANLWYDFKVDKHVVPYIGGGIGYARNHYKLSFYDALAPAGVDTNVLDETDSSFAFQLGAGVNFAIAHGTKLGIGYRYADLGEFEANLPWADPLVDQFAFENRHHSAVVSLNLDIH